MGVFNKMHEHQLNNNLGFKLFCSEIIQDFLKVKKDTCNKIK